MFSFLRNFIHRYLQSIYASLRFHSPKFLDLFLTYGDSPLSITNFRSVDRKWGPLIFYFPSQRRGGGGWGQESFPVKYLMWPSVYRVLQISLFIYDVSPFLDQVFRCFFSMDNLRGYGEDETMPSSSLGRSAAKLPSSSEGPSAPPPAQASVMAGSSPAVVPVTSGPVPTVSAPSQPASSVPQDSAPLPPGLLDDLSPPPPPAEPYEDFKARVRRDLSTLPVHPTQSVAAVPPRASVTATTTGTRLPTPFPRFEDSSWASQPQAPNTRIRMPLPASCYMAPPSPWVWPGRGSSVATTLVRVYQPASLPAAPSGPRGPSGCFAGPFTGGPSSTYRSCYWSKNPKMTSSTPPLRFRGFFFGATPPFIPSSTSAPSSSVNSMSILR